jgi:hypothetical protein
MAAPPPGKLDAILKQRAAVAVVVDRSQFLCSCMGHHERCDAEG